MRIGLVGCGDHMEGNILPAIRKQGFSEIVSVCTRNRESFDRKKHLFGRAKHYSKISSLTEDVDIDAVICCSTPEVHCQVILESLRNDKYLFIEKPSHTTFHQLSREIHQSRSNYSKVMLGYNFNHAPLPKLFLQSINQKIGQIARINVKCFANKPIEPIWSLDDNYSSFIYAVGIHAIDFIREFYEIDKIKDIRVDLRGSRNTKFYSHVLIIAEGSPLIELEFSNNCGRFIFDADCIFDNGEKYQLNGTRSILQSSTNAFGLEKTSEILTKVLPSGSVSGYDQEILFFLNAVRNKELFIGEVERDLKNINIASQIIKHTKG